MIPLSVIRAVILAASAGSEGPALPESDASSLSTLPTETAPSTLPIEANYTAAMPPGVIDSDGWHLSIGGGFVTTEDSDGPEEDVEFDEGFELMAGIMRRNSMGEASPWAFEWGAEVVWTDQDADNTDAQPVRDSSVIALYLEGQFDYALSPAWSLYGGAGVGGAWISTGIENDQLSEFSDDSGPFLAWNAKLGARWWTSPNVSWNLGYRLQNIDDAEIDDSSAEDADFSLETMQHIAEIGVRFLL